MSANASTTSAASAAQRSDELVERIAQRKAKYEKLYREKQTLLNADPAQAQQLSQRFFMLKCLGQTVFDDPRCRPAVLDRFESDAATVPRSFEDQVKIFAAAHAILTYIVAPQIAEQPVDVQRRIRSRALELNPGPVEVPAIHHGRYITKEFILDYFKQRSTPPHGARNIYEDEADAFADNPALLVGRRFVMYHGPDNQVVDYEVLRVGSSGAGRWMEVQHEDCVTVRLSGKDMDEVLEESFLVVDEDEEDDLFLD